MWTPVSLVSRGLLARVGCLSLGGGWPAFFLMCVLCCQPLLPVLFPAGGPEFLKTPLGGNFLVYESFLYRREKVAGEKVYWTCRDQARMGCRSRAITQGQRVMVMRRHCHPPDMGGLEALRQRENFPNLTHWEGPGMWRECGFSLPCSTSAPFQKLCLRYQFYHVIDCCC